MKDHRGLLIGWMIVLGASLVVLGVSPGFVALAWFAAVPLAIMTFAATRAGGEPALAHPRAYRALLVAILAAALVGMGSASATLALTLDAQWPGFISLATANLGLAIVTWRALIRPSPWRAGTVALVAVIGELAAFLADIFLGVTSKRLLSDAVPTHVFQLILISPMVAAFLGGLVGIAALRAFERATKLPAARVRDPG